MFDVRINRISTLIHLKSKRTISSLDVKKIVAVIDVTFAVAKRKP